jgi:hypothetical protein
VAKYFGTPWILSSAGSGIAIALSSGFLQPQKPNGATASVPAAILKKSLRVSLSIFSNCISYL